MDQNNSRRSTQAMASSDSSQASRLLQLVSDFGFFHTPEKEAYGRVWVNNHWETWALRSKAFNRFLRGQYYNEVKTAPRTEAIKEVIENLEASVVSTK